MSNLMIGDLSLVMDVPPNLLESADHMSFVISYFLNSIMMSSSILLSNLMRVGEFFFFQVL